ncbi:GEVED domain-containing protein [Chryseobacterium salivictor]|nr:GEVED domain-containing protein [Chryseobacterium salivictor]
MLFGTRSILKNKAAIVLMLLFTLLGFSNIHAQIAQRGIATEATATTAKTLTIAKPVGVVEGDLMIVNITQRGTTATLSDPTCTDWTPLINGVNLGGGSNVRVAVLYKIAEGAEPENFTFNLSANVDRSAGAIIAFLGVDKSSPFDVKPGTLNVTTNSSTVTATEITTVTDHAAIIMLGGSVSSQWSDWKTATSPGNLTELYNLQSTVSIGAAWAVKATAGKTGTGTAKLANRQQSAGILLALRPIALPSCSGTPAGGTAVLSPSVGLPSSAFTAMVAGDDTTSGLSHQWQTADSSGGPWINIPGATGATANITAKATPGIAYYRRQVSCTVSGFTSYSSVVSYTTQYCAAGVTSGNESTNYIKMVKFIGTLQDTSQSSTFSSTPAGYQDFTGNPVKSVQAQGNGVNLYVENFAHGMVKAWVDWNRDGKFDDPTEQVYTSNGTPIVSTTFGFVIPTTASPGEYTIRIRMNSKDGSNSFGPCGNINYAGETEDYSFTVIANCEAMVKSVVGGIRFGAGTVPLEATTSSSSTELRWYDALTGGTLKATTPVVEGASTWAPAVSSTTVYYVAAWNGTCESLVRVPIRATVRPVPVISFTPDTPTTCGSNSIIKISASGQNETNYLIDEGFENGWGGFTSTNLVKNGTTIDPKTEWQIRTSTYTPKEKVWFPAVASGPSGNKFAMATSDVGSSIINNVLVSPERNTLDYLSLTLSFRMYYSKYLNDEVLDENDYVAIEVNTDGGDVWTEVEKITKDVGYGTQFVQKSINVSQFKTSKFRFRIRYYANYRDGVAIDDIELFGVKPLSTSFSWTPSEPIDVYTDASATVPYVEGSKVTTVYMKPSLQQKEDTAGWVINAYASLTNGGTATGIVTIENKNKIWNVPGQNWVESTWKPIGLVPTINDCVYIKTPVTIAAGITGFAKEVYVERGGKLTISKDSSLKVQDSFANFGAPTDVIIESDGNLLQVNEGNAINTGSITARRIINLSGGRQQYNYLISPVEGQSLKNIYPGIDYVLYHNEANNFFYNSSGAYIKGRALAVKEPNKTGVPGTPATVTATFTGYPTNGAFTYSIVNSGTANINRGYNLVGNPYPSNIDLITFYNLNKTGGTLSPTFNLWDNRANSQTVQMGDQYGSQAYAVFNAVTPPEVGTGTRAAVGDHGLAGTAVPTESVKVGQGFMVKTSVANQQLIFNNTIRTKETGTAFFGKRGNRPPVDRYWLNMITPKNVASNIAVVYFEGGNNGFTRDDSTSLGGSDELYSVVEDRNVTINGRSSFSNSDSVPLGSRHFEAGQYKIELDTTEGIFANGQNIYLKDKQAGIITNLSAGNYTFETNAGESTGRFEIIYQPETVLATDSNIKENLAVYKNGDDFVIKSQSKIITALEVYDAAGRLINSSIPNQKEVRLPAASLVNGIYVLKIVCNGAVVIKKILR